MDIHNVGGTPGGARTFLLGIIMIVVGGYLLLDQVTVYGGYWRFGLFGSGTRASFGVTLVPMLFGIGILFTNGSSLVGRLLTVGGALFIVVGIIANMDIHFRRTSLFHTLTMLILIVGGLGLVARSIRPMGPGKQEE